ncbi:hypothetical protein SAMN03159473_00020 [Pseudomonas sp. NFACC52]|nr:hypothetical protein SAMN03159481_00020 [Pseudomonas sp. NFACC56-3]SFK08703.1 hypothetical protein SAMN03159473_00020 [Pseudomonas sp. NFACC52]
MSCVPAFTDFLLTHLQQEERKRILKSIVVTVAPELWLSLESAALLICPVSHCRARLAPAPIVTPVSQCLFFRQIPPNRQR